MYKIYLKLLTKNSLIRKYICFNMYCNSSSDKKKEKRLNLIQNELFVRCILISNYFKDFY